MMSEFEALSSFGDEFETEFEIDPMSSQKRNWEDLYALNDDMSSKKNKSSDEEEDQFILYEIIYVDGKLSAISVDKREIIMGLTFSHSSAIFNTEDHRQLILEKTNSVSCLTNSGTLFYAYLE